MSKIKYNAKQVGSVFNANPSHSSVFITSDGNVFYQHSKNAVLNHCRLLKAEYEVLTRAEFEKENSTDKKSKDKNSATTSTATTDGLTDDNWKTGKFQQIIAFAQSKGLAPTTKPTQGTTKLILEVEALIAASVAAKESDWKEGTFEEILAFATEKGLNPKTESSQGIPALIEEVEGLLTKTAE